MHKKEYIPVTLCFMLSVMLYASAMDKAQEIQQLEKLEKDRDRTKQKKVSVLAREKSVLTELRDIEKDLTAREKELRIYRHNLARCEKEIKQLNEALAEVEARAKQTQTLMVKRLRAMYKFSYQEGQVSYLKLLLGSENISDLTTRYKYMSAIATSDRELLEKAAAEKAEIDLKKEQVEARKKRILNYQAGAKRTKDIIDRRRKKRQETLENLRRSKQDLTKTLAELERAVREKESLIARLQDSSTTEIYEDISDLGKERGKLPWPASGKVIKNSAPSMKGVTIQAKYGANIRCIAGGKVEYSQWFDGVGFGQMVIIDHGNGYRTLYAHASELLVEKGQKVKAGHIIARVGDTGSLSGSILYFELWKGTKAMETKRWLR
ncbi:murein hydrolase activator EnvC family protein [Candidatus Poribacteria bacterium]